MEFSLKTTILLKKYLNGDLPKTEAALLESRLLNEPDLKEELEMTKLLMGETEKLESQRLLTLINQVEENAVKEKIVEKPFWRKNSWRVAAVVLTLLAAGIWWYFGQTNEINTFIAASYISPISPTNRSGTDNFSLAFQAFEDKEFQRSLTLLQTYSEADSIYYDVLRLEGHNFFKLNQAEKSIDIFEEAIAFQNDHPKIKIEDSENVNWSRLLAMLRLMEEHKINKKDFIRELENFISTADQNDIYYKKAIQLRSLL